MIIGVYFPPKSNTNSYVCIFSVLEFDKSSYPNIDIIIYDDFNLPSLYQITDKNLLYSLPLSCL